jgi:cytochrome P450
MINTARLACPIESGEAPGPRALPLLGHFREFNCDRTGFLARLARDHGDVVQFRLGWNRFFLLAHPDYIRDVLITHQTNFHKGRALTRAKRLMGEGLVTSEEAFHLRQRRLMQPAFHRQRIALYAKTMAERAARLADAWQDGSTVEMRQEMTRLTLGIVCKVLFSTEAEGDAAEVGHAFNDLMALTAFMLAPFSEYLEKLPLPQSIRFRRAKARLDRVVYRIIRERRQSTPRAIDARQEDMREQESDLLSTLLAAEDHEGGTGGMADEQVHDELMTLVVAGHETLSNALPFTWYLLSQHPAVEAKLHEEIDSVLGDRLPTLEDLARLPYTEMVLAESMRLYPPVWFLGRRALQPYEVGGFTIPKGSYVVLSQWVTHHDRRFYPDPERFDPQRWTPEARASRPKLAFFPFGAGVRGCIGESFGWTEGRLVLAVLAQRWRIRLAPGHPVAIDAVSTLRPKHGIRMTVHRR